MPDFALLLHWMEEMIMPYNEIGLFILAFVESSFFPLPPDALLIPLALRNPGQALELALITSAGSVLGGGFGYWLGKVGGRPVLRRFASERRIRGVTRLFREYGFWAVGIAGFTPIPYKIVTIAAGAFLMNFKQFFLASLLSRSARFFLAAVLIRHYGATIVGFLTSQFEAVTLIIVFLVVAGSFLLRKRRQ